MATGRRAAVRVGINGLFLSRPDAGSGQYLVHLIGALASLGAKEEYVILEVGNSSIEGFSSWVLRNPFGGRNENLAKLWFEQISFPRAGLNMGLDVLHVPYFAPPLWKPRPVVVTVHDLIPMILPDYRGSALVRAYTRLVAAASRTAALILADSEASRRDVLRLLRVPAGRVRTVYLAADPAFRPPDPEAVGAVRRKYGLEKPYVLYLGGFDRRKNVVGLVRAFARLPQSIQDRHHLVIAGRLPPQDSEFFPDPRSAAQRAGVAGGVIFLGWVPEEEKPALYGGATCFAFPSIYEGFGLPPLEAMACGTPVVASNAGSLPEIVGDGGLLVEPSDQAALVEALVRLLEDADDRHLLSRRALEQASRFTWERTALETLAAYREAGLV
jgi:glycosyltransferase involved in cell wall biosynthesis